VIDAELSYVLGDQEYLLFRMLLGIFRVSFDYIDSHKLDRCSRDLFV
jgi:hypothetical protein